MRGKLIHIWLQAASRNRRVAVIDLLLLAAAVYVGFAMRLTLTLMLSPQYREEMLRMAAVYPVCVAALLWLMGIYRVHWPQASVEEYARLTRAYIFGSALFLCVNLFSRFLRIPRSSLAITLLAGLVFIGAVRASWRLSELSLASGGAPAAKRKRTIIIGAGEAGAFIARDLQRRGSDLSTVGFIDGDAQKRGKVIAGLPVLGGDGDLVDIAAKNDIKVALIAIPSAGGAKVRKYLDALAALNIDVRVLPSLRELADGRIEAGSMRPVELQDLLRREPIRLDEARIETVISGKRVLVTGAGGSIGSEICTQIAAHSPSDLIVLGHGEQSIYNLLAKLGESGVTAPCHPVIADIADSRAIGDVFERYRPEVVFHAAAHKHVPLMEENPREALRVNALGTWTIADIAGRHSAERFVMISTDKAVHPSSVMGATKRIAERLLRNAQESHPGTRFIAVRFGNVLGSRGSVVPLFERQIARGGPVTVTHPDMRRYFMLIPEAVSLVLQAASMGRGGELYVLDMGEPVNIAEMAEMLIRLHGREPYADIRIEFTGIRPGEKLFEELFYDPAHVDRTSHDKIFLSILESERDNLIGEVGRVMASRSGEEDIRESIFNLAGGQQR